MDNKLYTKCRVCLGEFDIEKMFDLFSDTKAKSINIETAAERHEDDDGCDDDDGGDDTKNNLTAKLRLFEKVEFCCGVHIRESSEMPNKICIKCFDMTRMWFNFRQMCLNSQAYLESLCNDRLRPPELQDDDSKYLEYLLEDLQTFRANTRRSNEAAFLFNTDDIVIMSDNEADDTVDSMFETIQVDNLENDFNVELDDTKRETDDSDEDAVAPRKATTRGKKRKKPGTSGPTTFMCSVCGNVYTKKASFAYHMGLHADVKPHECELCGKTFRQVCELKNHMRRHTGEKPYKCSYCSRSFIDRSEKHRHERIHTNTRPYMCNICGKSFMYSTILKNHSKLHSGQRDYNCLVCQKSFTLHHQLKAHLQTITHKQKEAQFSSAEYDAME